MCPPKDHALKLLSEPFVPLPSTIADNPRQVHRPQYHRQKQGTFAILQGMLQHGRRHLAPTHLRFLVSRCQPNNLRIKDSWSQHQIMLLISHILIFHIGGLRGYLQSANGESEKPAAASLRTLPSSAHHVVLLNEGIFLPGIILWHWQLLCQYVCGRRFILLVRRVEILLEMRVSAQLRYKSDWITLRIKRLLDQSVCSVVTTSMEVAMAG